MKKQLARFVAFGMCLALLAACSGMQNDEAQEQSGASPSTTTYYAPPNSSPGYTEQECEAAIERYIQAVLDLYHSGDFPEPIVWGTDVASAPPLPAGCALPETVAKGDYTYTTEDGGLYGDGWKRALLPLGDNYALEFILEPPHGEFTDFIFAHFDVVDLLPEGSVEEYTAAAAELSNIRYTRLHIYAEIDRLEYDGITMSGFARWDESRSFIFVDVHTVGEEYYSTFCVYEITGPNAMQQVYPFGDAYTNMPTEGPFSDEVTLRQIAYMMHSVMLDARDSAA